MENRNAVILGLALLALLLAGCLQPPMKIGCCLKDNATNREGCVLYNDSNDQITDLRASTYNEADGQKCNVSAGYCNVSLNESRPPYLVPICTEADILSCRQPDCLSMVCGDFKYKPPVAPGLNVEGDEVKADVPADVEEETAVQFYHAQCRFLPLDNKLKKVMKSSKSSLNVFRMGVGGSFDEYEQYRYFFPMSDKFCAVNPPRKGELRVDRYVNYLNPSSLEQFDPIEDITSNCIDDSGGAASPLPPFQYDESSLTSRSGHLNQGYYSTYYNYTVVLKDKSSYKFAHWGRLDYADFDNTYGGFQLFDPYFDNTSSVYKKIDESFYKKWLSIAHADTIYGQNPEKKNSTRAPFECDSASTECYSGMCSITTYNRVVMLTPPDSTGKGQEVVTDCESYTDENHKTRIICSPTTKVTITGPTTQPTKTYAKVEAKTVHVEGLSIYESAAATCGIFDSNHLDSFYDWLYNGGGYGYGDPWGDATCTGAMDSPYIAGGGQVKADVGSITNTASGALFYWNGTEWLSSFSEATDGPPAGGALFFGDVEPQATYKGTKVIGYALASKSQVKDLLVVKNCEMVEGQDYEIVDVPDDLKQWGELKDTFAGYFRLRFGGMKAIANGDNCGATACKLYDDAPTMACSNFYDFFWPGMPWVINFDKQASPAYGGPGANLLLSSEISMGTRKINRFSENYVGTSEASTCALRGLTSGYYASVSRNKDDTNYYIWEMGPKPTYDLLYSRYIVLFYDKGDEKIGKCAIDKATGMPQVRTFGWCEPCTTSTLAYQNITNKPEPPYIPGGIANIEDGGDKDLNPLQSRICMPQEGDLQCANDLISDAKDYSITSDQWPGSPKTIPEATVLKERMGNYMKSGVMPVLDLSDSSNWVETMDEYDFQRLVGTMGAAIIIVDHVDNESDAATKAKDIADRTALVRTRCFGCLTAFHVNSPKSNESFQNITHTVFSTNFASKFTTDMVTFDYPVSLHSPMLPAMGTQILAADPGANLTKNYSVIIAHDIASYSLLVLQKDGKPTMLVGLNLDSSDTVFTPQKYDALFDEIVLQQQDLIKAGLTGIIYSPARQVANATYTGPKVGIVDVSSEGVGSKNAKFCAMQSAMQRMNAAPPIAVYAMSNAVNKTECVACSSLEKTQGVCDEEALKCDNAVKCTPPAGLSESDIAGVYKCPANTVIDDPTGERCKLCSDLSGKYTCTFSYSNGTIETRKGNMTDLNSDAYLDIIAGIPSTDKCCLEDPLGRRYTYTKTSSDSQVNRPIAFSKSGDQAVDCGLTADIDSLKEAMTFCDVEIPIKDYDVSCYLG